MEESGFEEERGRIWMEAIEQKTNQTWTWTNEHSLRVFFKAIVLISQRMKSNKNWFEQKVKTKIHLIVLIDLTDLIC